MAAHDLNRHSVSASEPQLGTPTAGPGQRGAAGGEAPACTPNPAASCPLHVAGVVVDSGSLETLREMLAALPQAAGLAIIVFPVDATDVDSIESPVREPAGPLRRRLARSAISLEEGQLYLVPAGSRAIVAEQRLLVTEADGNESEAAADEFLRALAQEYGRYAIAIQLAEGGAAATLEALQAVGRAGGLSLAPCASQDAEAATGDAAVDEDAQEGVITTISPERIAETISRYTSEGLTPEDLSEGGAAALSESPVGRMIEALRNDTQLDFSYFRPSVLTRRARQRCHALGESRLEDYAGRVEDDAEERERFCQTLFADTCRPLDSDALLERLRHELQGMLAAQQHTAEGSSDQGRGEVRAWVVGCGSGEEAYRLAILLQELAEPINGQRPLVRVFATDMQFEPLKRASAGIYTEEQLPWLEPEHLGRYFCRVRDGFQVTSELRQMLVFAPLYLATDAPFLRLDLVYCRNRLQHLRLPARRRILTLFKFGLRRKGLLLLGPGRAPVELPREFETLDDSLQLFRKRATSLSEEAAEGASDPVPWSARTEPAQIARRDDQAPSPIAAPGDAAQPTEDEWVGPAAGLKWLAERYAPTGWLLDSQERVVQSLGQAQHYLVPDLGETEPLWRRVPDALGIRIAEVLGHLRRGALEAATAGVVHQGSDPSMVWRISAHPVDAPSTRGWIYLRLQADAPHPSRLPARLQRDAMEWIDAPDRHDRSTPADGATAPEAEDSAARAAAEAQRRLEELSEELRDTRQNLQSAILEQEATNAALRRVNDELTRGNQQLLDTNEQLRSVNQELYSVNADHQRKILELVELTDDMDNLLVSTEVGVIFLTSDLRIRRFTPLISAIFGILSVDIGRSIESFAHHLQYDGFLDDLRNIQRNRGEVDREVRDATGRYYLLRIVPYRSKNPNEQPREDIVVTLVDVERIKQTESEMQRLSDLVHSSDDAIIGLDSEGRVMSWNQGAELLYGYSEADAQGQPLQQLVVPEDQRDDYEGLLETIRRGGHVEHLETIRRRQDGKRLHVSVRISPLHGAAGQVVGFSGIDRDISSLIEARDQVRTQDIRMRSIMESVTQAIIVLDDDWRYIYVNDGTCELLGRPREELLGSVVWELFRDTQSPGFYERFHEARDQRKTVRFEAYFAPQDRWYECFCYPSDQGLTVFFGNVTERRRAEGLIRQQAEMLSLSHDAILVWELDGPIRYWNRGAERLYGYSAEEAVGQRSMLLLKSRHPMSWEEIEAAILRDGQWVGVIQHVTRDGRVVTVSTRQQFFYQEEEDRRLVLEVNRDITEQQQIERRLQLLAAVSDNTTDLVGTATADGRLMFLNRGGRQMLGWQSDVKFGERRLADLHPDWAAQVILNEAMPAAALGHVWSGENAILGPGGVEIPVSQVVLAHFDGAGNVTHYSTIARDITDQKEHESALERMREAAEAANRAKSSFLAHMSHEIRTPMTAILGCAEQLELRLTDSENRQLVRVLREQGGAMLALLDDILDISKIEAEKLTVELHTCSLIQILSDVRTLMSVRAKERGLRLRLKYASAVPRQIHTDPGRLRQILVNLISNACKFTDHGEVRIEARVERKGRHGKRQAPQLAITVQDSGIGIPPDQLNRIFEAFARAEQPQVRRAEGTGLGLAICKRLSELLGGSLEVASTPNVGSTFTVRLPLPAEAIADVVDPVALESAEPVAEEANWTLPLPLRVLVAEDTGAIRFLLDRMLRDTVRDLVIVEDGRAAVEAVEAAAARGEPFDLVLMDMQMPVMDGAAATRTIRQTGHRMQIVALTAAASAGDREQSLASGCDDHLAKPIDRNRLIGILRRLVPEDSAPSS